MISLNRPTRNNKRIGYSDLLLKHPYLAELRMLKGIRDVNSESRKFLLTGKTGELELVITLVLYHIIDK